MCVFVLLHHCFGCFADFSVHHLWGHQCHHCRDSEGLSVAPAVDSADRRPPTPWSGMADLEKEWSVQVSPFGSLTHRTLPVLSVPTSD